MKKFIVCTDIHGNHQDEEAVDCLLRFTKKFNPDIRVIAGDLFDFACIRGKASIQDKAEPLDEDFEMGLQFLCKFFKMGSENVLMLGNHDHRAWKLQKESTRAEAVELATRMIRDIEEYLKKYNATMYPYSVGEGVYPLGDACVIHGFDASINAARWNAATYQKVLFGHTHNISQMPFERFGQTGEGYNIGCLCGKMPEYASFRRATLRWQHGFAYGYIIDGVTHINQARIYNGKTIDTTGKLI